MITGKTEGHRKLATMAAQCFLDQTYVPRKLLVINTSITGPWFQEMATDHDSRIVEIVIHQGNKTLGDLRNYSYDLATESDLLMQWDDDDHHHADRMTWQVVHHLPGYCSILQRQYRLNLYGSWGIADGSTWNYKGIVGTMLHEPNEFRYPSLRKAEDSAYLSHYGAIDRVNPQDNPPELYVRLYHGANTWGRSKIMRPALTGGRKFQGDKTYVESVRSKYIWAFSDISSDH